MLECNAIYNTPVRHDELSITKTSFRSRLLVSNINHRTTREKTRKNSFGDRNVKKRLNSMSVPFEMNNYSTFSEKKSEESVIENEISLMKAEEEYTDQKTQCPNVDQPDITSDVHIEEESIVQEQKYSSPKIKTFPTKAVSSTPNQELFNHSKLSRSASTQTTFTLGPSNSGDLINNLRSYCVEIPNKENLGLNVDPNFKLSCNADTSCTSPLRNLWTKKLICYDNTPVKNNTSVRKLSLRSKTMICSAMERTKDRSNTFIKYKSAEETRFFSNTFSTMPHPKTPPSSTSNIFHNPFEKDLTDRLGKSIFSPNVFDVVVSPSEDSEDLRWTIEDISSINPVPIDEDFTIQSDEEDPDKESQVQQEIDRYFSETHLVLSPFENPVLSEVSKIRKMFPVSTAASTPQKINVVIELKNACTQTTLTLPETLPEELEKSLTSYFKFFDMDDLNLSASNLRRKLFFHSGDEPLSPVRFESCSSPIMKNSWNDFNSPYAVTENKRHYTPRAGQQELSSPEVSPVLLQCTSMKLKPSSISSCKKKLHHHFPGDQEPSEEVKEDIRYVGPVVNSTVLMTSSDRPSGMTLDCSTASSALPSSQDTGYHTEESWRNSPNKPLNSSCSVMASTPTNKIQ